MKLAGVALLGLVLGLALAADIVSTHDPLAKDIQHGLTERGEPLPPSFDQPLGTDWLGRSVLARVLHGARISLLVGVSSALLATAIGGLVGATAGYAGGRVDALLVGATDLFLSFPALLLAVAMTAARYQPTEAPTRQIGGTVLLLSVVGWTPISRAVRARVQVLRSSPFVVAARGVGVGTYGILRRHLWPNLTGLLFTLFCFAVAQAILAEATLAYLGLGVAPPVPSWGLMLAEGQSSLRCAPWLVIVPSSALALTVGAFILLGEAARRSRPGAVTER
jgi:peptide/nickel transport system permease protein